MSNSKTTRRRALVTGATGYIGSKLVVHLFAAGWEVHVIVRQNAKLDVLKPLLSSISVHEHDGSTGGMIEIVGASKPDIVFHLASLFLAQHKPDDIEALIASNLLFSTQLAEAMVANGVKQLVNTSTSWQHHENAQYNPVNLYAATKQGFEAILAYYVEAAGLKVISLALFDTYGPGDPRPKLVHLLWKTALNNEHLAMSPGEQLIDLVYIDDVIAAFAIAADQIVSQQSGHLRYGLSSGAPLPLRDLVKAFEEATDTKVDISWGGRPYRTREVMTTWSTFERLPDWTPKVAFADGIKQTRPN